MKLKIKSSQRMDANTSQTSSPGECYIKLTNPVSGRWTLRQVCICADYPNINNLNNTIPFFENGVDKIATLPAGYYNSSDIITALQTALNTASGGYNTYTCSLNSVSQQLTITSAVNPFQLKFGTFPSGSGTVLGFPVAANSSLGLSVTAPSIVVANTVLAFNIKIDGCSSIIDAAGQSTSFDVPMNVNVSPMGWVTYEPSENFRQSITFGQPQRILHIRICDDNGVTLNLQQDWTMIWESLD